VERLTFDLKVEGRSRSAFEVGLDDPLVVGRVIGLQSFVERIISLSIFTH